MTQVRKDELFKALWKFVFIINDDDCQKNRESNFWGLLFLYNENRSHYQELLRNDESHYFDKLKLETFTDWCNEKGVEANYYSVSIFNKISRIIHLIKFIEYAPEIYRVMNDYSKNVLQQSINHMYISDNVVETSLYQSGSKNKDLFQQQVVLKSQTAFLSQNMAQHFEVIFKMISNYTHTQSKLTEPNNYSVLNEKDLDILLIQSEYMGSIDEFLKFLIEYCAGAEQYWQASVLFKYLLKYTQQYFKEDHFYFLFARMNGNSQFYDNKDICVFLDTLEKEFENKFGRKFLSTSEEKYLYSKLYKINVDRNLFSTDKVLLLLEDRARYYSIRDLPEIFFDVLQDDNNKAELRRGEISHLYPNILGVLENKNDPNYKEHYVDKFRKLLVGD